MEAPPFSSRTLKEKSKLHQVHIKKKLTRWSLKASLNKLHRFQSDQHISAPSFHLGGFLVWIWCPNQNSGDPGGPDFFLGGHPKVTRLQTSDYYSNYRLL